MPRRARQLLLPLAAAAALAAIAAPAYGAPDLARNFKLSGDPQRIAKGPDGNIWVTISGSSENNELARIKPNGNLKEFDLPGVTNPTGVGKGKGSLWLTQLNAVVEVPPKSPGDAEVTTIVGGLTPQEITGGPEDRIYTVSNDQFISFDPGNPAGYTDETIGGMGARGIIGSGGRLWIADFGGQRIVRVSADGQNTKFFNTNGNPRQVAAGANEVVAYTDPGTDPHTVGRIVNNDVKKTKAPNTDATGITKAGGNWWTANPVSHDIGRLTPGGSYKRFDVLPNNADARYIAAGKNGTLYVALTAQQKVSLIKGVG